MAILWARFIANAITFYILWNYITSQLRRYDSQGHKLDKDQVIDNIKNDRRFDWGTGEEENWRHKWNPRHPVERKPVTLFGIIIKSFLLYYVAGTIIEVIVYKITGV